MCTSKLKQLIRRCRELGHSPIISDRKVLVTHNISRGHLQKLIAEFGGEMFTKDIDGKLETPPLGFLNPLWSPAKK